MRGHYASVLVRQQGWKVTLDVIWFFSTLLPSTALVSAFAEQHLYVTYYLVVLKIEVSLSMVKKHNGMIHILDKITEGHTAKKYSRKK